MAAMVKRSISLDAALVEQALRIAGPRGFSRLLNAALRQYLQSQRLGRLETEPILVTILEEGQQPNAPETALLSEAMLAEDWNRPEEERAWSHMQSGR